MQEKEEIFEVKKLKVRVAVTYKGLRRQDKKKMLDCLVEEFGYHYDTWKHRLASWCGDDSYSNMNAKLEERVLRFILSRDWNTRPEEESDVAQ